MKSSLKTCILALSASDRILSPTDAEILSAHGSAGSAMVPNALAMVDLPLPLRPYMMLNLLATIPSRVVSSVKHPPLIVMSLMSRIINSSA